jgi:hypothetical protein
MKLESRETELTMASTEGNLASIEAKLDRR